jgi:hypothetical protein
VRIVEHLSTHRVMIFGSNLEMTSVDSLTHVIQVALTPVFLLSAIAALLNVFSTRLVRVADQVDQISAKLKEVANPDAGDLAAQFAYLRRRSVALEMAVVLGTLGATATCGAAFALFLGALRNSAAVSMLFALFGLALLCTILAITAFMVEMLMAGRGLRAEAGRTQQKADEMDSNKSQSVGP